MAQLQQDLRAAHAHLNDVEASGLALQRRATELEGRERAAAGRAEEAARQLAKCQGVLAAAQAQERAASQVRREGLGCDGRARTW